MKHEIKSKPLQYSVLRSNESSAMKEREVGLQGSVQWVQYPLMWNQESVPRLGSCLSSWVNPAFLKNKKKLTWANFLSGHQLVDLDLYLIYQSWAEAYDSFNLPDLPSSPGILSYLWEIFWCFRNHQLTKIVKKTSNISNKIQKER